MASAREIFERTREQRGDEGASGAAGQSGEPAGETTAGGAPGSEGVPGSEGEWEQSNQIPGGGSEAQTADGETPEGAAGGGASDDELDGALEDFDGEILAERQIILARSNDAAGTREPPGAGGTGRGGSSGDQGEPGTAQSGSSTSGAMPDAGTLPIPRPPIPSAPRGDATAAVEVPDDVPDASDDDVVARQLREAAMNETDPELREKLWDEYRRYKSGS